MFLQNPLPDFSDRSNRDEWMEDPELDFDTLAETVDAVERASWLSGGQRVSLAGLEELVDSERDRLSVLDVGMGNGGLSRAIATWGDSRGIQVDVLGVDLLPKAVEAARGRHRRVDGVRFECADLFEIDEGRTFDIAHASLVLHHFPGREALRALDKMAQLAELGVVVNDLHRHPIHWFASKCFLPLVTRNEIAIHDGPVSVLRGFRRRELLDLGRRSSLACASIEWRFPFRWLLVGEV